MMGTSVERWNKRAKCGHHSQPFPTPTARSHEGHFTDLHSPARQLESRNHARCNSRCPLWAKSGHHRLGRLIGAI